MEALEGSWHNFEGRHTLHTNTLIRGKGSLHQCLLILNISIKQVAAVAILFEV